MYTLYLYIFVCLFRKDELSEYDEYYGFPDQLRLHPYDHTYNFRRKKVIAPMHILAFLIETNRFDRQIINEDIWKSISIDANSADSIASKLEIPGFTGDMLFKYVCDYLQPTLCYNREIPLQYKVDELKAKEIIPIRPKQHLWYDIWNHTLKKQEGYWFIEGKVVG